MFLPVLRVGVEDVVCQFFVFVEAVVPATVPDSVDFGVSVTYQGLAAAQAQLRHKSESTTMRYDQVPVEERRDALNRM